MKQVTTKELREFLMNYLREKKKISERSCNHYNSVIRFIYDVVLDMPINQKQVPMYKKKRKLPKNLQGCSGAVLRLIKVCGRLIF